MKRITEILVTLVREPNVLDKSLHAKGVSQTGESVQVYKLEKVPMDGIVKTPRSESQGKARTCRLGKRRGELTSKV